MSLDKSVTYVPDRSRGHCTSLAAAPSPCAARTVNFEGFGFHFMTACSADACCSAVASLLRLEILEGSPNVERTLDGRILLAINASSSALPGSFWTPRPLRYASERFIF